MTPLMIAAQLHSQNLTDWLLQKGADPNRGVTRHDPNDPNDYPYNAGDAAVYEGEVEIWETLREHGLVLTKSHVYLAHLGFSVEMLERVHSDTEPTPDLLPSTEQSRTILEVHQEFIGDRSEKRNIMMEKIKELYVIQLKVIINKFGSGSNYECTELVTRMEQIVYP